MVVVQVRISAVMATVFPETETSHSTHETDGPRSSAPELYRVSRDHHLLCVCGTSVVDGAQNCYEFAGMRYVASHDDGAT